MKRLIAISLCLLLLCGCAAPAVYNGPTKSAWVLTEQKSTYFSDQYGATEDLRVIFFYDTYGNQIQSNTYRDGELSSQRKYTYDDRGNVISTENWDHSGLIPWPISRTGYTFDTQDRPLATIYRNFLGLERSRDTYTYDDEANTILWEGHYDTKTTWLDENGNPLRSQLYSKPAGACMETLLEYDELGRNTKITGYYDNAIISTTVLSYDDQDRLTEETYYDADGTVLSRRTYHYEENTVTTYELGGTKTVETYRPDGQVQKTEQFDKTGKLTRLIQYTYQEIQVPEDWKE